MTEELKVSAPVGEDITEEAMNAEAQAQAAIDADEVAQRVRALGMAIVTLIAQEDRKADRADERTAGDPAFRIMEASLDLLDLYMRDHKRLADAMEKMANVQAQLVELQKRPILVMEPAPMTGPNTTEL